MSQGGDHGSVISDALARQAPNGLLAIHLNMPATVPGDLMKSINSGDPAPAGLTPAERDAYDSLSTFFGRNAAYGAMMVTRPQTIGYSLADSPSGMAAWMVEKFAQWSASGGDPERVLTKDEMLNDVTLYWLTNTGASSSRFYWENNNNNFSSAAQKTTDIKIPVAISVFPHEIYRAPKSWSERAYPTLYYYHQVAKGGHFAAWEQPQLLAEELRAAFRPVRRQIGQGALSAAAPRGQRRAAKCCSMRERAVLAGALAGVRRRPVRFRFRYADIGHVGRRAGVRRIGDGRLVGDRRVRCGIARGRKARGSGGCAQVCVRVCVIRQHGQPPCCGALNGAHRVAR